VDGQLVQRIQAPSPCALDVVDLSTMPESDRARAFEDELRPQLRTAFDIEKGPLVRWRLVRLASNEHVLIHVEHHFVHDGWSFNVFLTELAEYYRASLTGRA